MEYRAISRFPESACLPLNTKWAIDPVKLPLYQLQRPLVLHRIKATPYRPALRHYRTESLVSFFCLERCQATSPFPNTYIPTVLNIYALTSLYKRSNVIMPSRPPPALYFPTRQFQAWSAIDQQKYSY
jgi:hypothetical protein